MFLKINFQESTKKIKFHNKYHKFEEFKKLVEELTKLPLEQLEVSFLDSESDKINIQDRHDLEYFID